MKIFPFVCGMCLVLSVAMFAQETLTNNSIEKMEKAGLGDDVLISMIQSQPGNYDVTPDTLIALKAEGISDKVLAAMAAKGSGAAVTPAAYEDLDIGVYHQVRGGWIPIATEPVNWKTGGALKTTATDGILKGDVNGRIMGASSATQMNSPLEFLIRMPDGVEATDFQLVRLHEKSNAREFRTVTGGVFHASGGSSRDAVAFEETKVARRTYKVRLAADLPQGEYAFLAPGLTGSSASGSTGEAYTFRLVE